MVQNKKVQFVRKAHWARISPLSRVFQMPFTRVSRGKIEISTVKIPLESFWDAAFGDSGKQNSPGSQPPDGRRFKQQDERESGCMAWGRAFAPTLEPGDHSNGRQ